MKFKKIEISAFRIYDNPGDATFDFLTHKGEVANFVAIYAPNGFGKTSFYDAVEWAMTNSINRFHIRGKELKNLAEYQYLENELPLIRNSRSERETYVSIVFEDDKVQIVPFKKHGKQRHDLNLDKPVVHDFQRVILSQEWISAFLTESDGETRYKKFMENPELVEVSNYYNNLKHLHSAYVETTTSLDKEITLLRFKIINDGNNNLLTNINNQIVSLRGRISSSNLKNVTLSTTQEEIKDLKDFISGQTISITRQLEDLVQLNERLNVVLTGNDKLPNLNTFYYFKGQLPLLHTTLDSVRTNITRFQTVEEIENDLLSLNEQLKIELDNRDATNKILSAFVGYEKTDSDLSLRSTTKSKIESTLPETNKSLEKQIRLELNLKNQIESLVKKILSQEESIARIPQTKQLIAEINATTKLLEKEIDARKIEFRELSNQLKDQRNSIQNLNNNLSALRQNVFSSIHGWAENLVQLEALKQTNSKIDAERKSLQSIRQKITEQKEFNNAVSEFVQAGLHLVNERKLSECPLCEHGYASHNHLVETISNNKLLEEHLQKLLLEESGALAKISELETSLIENRSIVEQNLLQQLSVLDGDIKNLQAKQESINAALVEGQSQQRFQASRLFEIQVEFKGGSVDEYLENLEERLKLDKENRKKLEEDFAVILTERERLQNVVLLAKQELSRLAEDISLLQRDVNYNQVIRWFELNQLSLPDRNVLTTEINTHNSKILELKERIQQAKKNADELKTQLSTFDKNTLKASQKELELKIRELENATQAFNQFVNKSLDVDIQTLSIEELSKFIAQQEVKGSEQIAAKKILYDELLILARYCENIVDFLQSERLKIELQEKEDEYRFLMTTVKPRIENEIEKTKVFLTTKIKDFFYTDLINDIYKKIDPHPDFREVRFKADLDAENPRLDIFVRNSRNTEALIPNLYFSTAQINILSLSIFLASALNSRDYKCIFVDDPVQSMDSINILSTIDLIRSIVVNGDRQVILSTHDKNFFDVLKRKIPATLFKSTFLELESFGKVSQSGEVV